jgi:DNA-binding NarL/FixJ family response regulator
MSKVWRWRMSGFPGIANGRAKKVVVVDPMPVVCCGLAAILKSEGDLELCGQAGGEAEAFRVLEEVRPDLVISEIILKEGDGLELVRRARDRYEELRLLILSRADELLYADRVLRAGALGYVHKSVEPAELLAAIRRVLAGGVHLSAAATERLLNRTASGQVSPDPVERLSNRELSVFRLLGQGLPTREVAGLLYLSVKTVETYREHIKSKLGLKNGSELGRWAVRWVMEESR